MIRSTQQYVDGLRNRVPTYSAAELADALATRDDLLVVDIRELPELVEKGAIAGSRHVPRGMLEFWADPAMGYYREFFGTAREIVVHCAGGQRSVLAAVTLQEMGYKHVAHLDGGFGAWEAAGLPIEDYAATSKWMRRPEESAD